VTAALAFSLSLQIRLRALGIDSGNFSHGFSDHLMMAGHADGGACLQPALRQIVELFRGFLISPNL
jgi:hypothetical protein